MGRFSGGDPSTERECAGRQRHGRSGVGTSGNREQRKLVLTYLILACFTLLGLCNRVPPEGISGVFMALFGYVLGSRGEKSG